MKLLLIIFLIIYEIERIMPSPLFSTTENPEETTPAIMNFVEENSGNEGKSNKIMLANHIPSGESKNRKKYIKSYIDDKNPGAFKNLGQNNTIISKKDEIEVQNVDVLEIFRWKMPVISPIFFFLLGYQNLTELKITKSDIHLIDVNAFQGLYNLKVLDLRKNKIEIVTKGAFVGLDNLEELLLSSNHIKFFENGSLLNLVNLEYLDLKNNNLLEIPGDIEKLSNLRYLDLSSNDLKELNVNMKSNSLNVLRLSSCKLLTLTDNAFKDVPNLVLLDISKNHFITLPSLLLYYLNKLILLDVSENNIYKNFPDIFIPKNLKKIVNESQNGNSDYKGMDEEVLNARRIEMKTNKKITLLERGFLKVVEIVFIFLWAIFLVIISVKLLMVALKTRN